MWGFGDDVIVCAAELCAGKSYPSSAVNRLLSEWKSRGVRTVEDAKRVGAGVAAPADKAAVNSSRNFKERTYTAEELKAVMTSMDDLDENDV